MIVLFGSLMGLLACALFLLLGPLLRVKTIPSRQRLYFVISASCAFTLVSFGIYMWVGAPKLIPVIAQRDRRIEELTAEITTNLDMVKANPKSLSAWVTLGTDFLETGQIDSAVGAFKQAVLLSGGDPTLVLAYAKAQIMQADGKVTDEAKRGLEIVLMMQPQNPDARYFMIVRKLQDGNVNEAMKDMKTLYNSLPPASPLKATIDRQIGKNP